MIDFRIDRRSGIPTYVQLVLQVKQALRLGDLQVGDRLPTAKDVVGALAINPNTAEGLQGTRARRTVAPRPGLGTFVVKSLAKPGMAESSALRRELARWVADAVAAGLERTDIEALVSLELEKTFIESDPSGKQGETS